VPVDVIGLAISAIAVGVSYGCALTATNNVRCWGANDDGVLGDGTTTDRHVAVSVSGLTTGVAAIAGGAGFVCALTHAGAVTCWGNNLWSQLGNGEMTKSEPVPVAVVGLTSDVSAIAAGYHHSCAIVGGGEKIWCWGGNGDGSLGNNSTNASMVPVEVVGF